MLSPATVCNLHQGLRTGDGLKTPCHSDTPTLAPSPALSALPLQALLLFGGMLPAQLCALPAPNVSPTQLAFLCSAVWHAGSRSLCLCHAGLKDPCACHGPHLACCDPYHAFDTVIGYPLLLQAASALGPQQAAHHGDVASPGAAHLPGACPRHPRLRCAGRLCCHPDGQGGRTAHATPDGSLWH